MKKRKDILEYEDAPSGAIRLYNYKEPFIPVPNGGYGFMGVLMHDAVEDLIQCHVCGEWFTKLANHVTKHGFKNVAHYKKEFGLSNSTALIAEGLRDLYIQNGQKNCQLSKAYIKARRRRAIILQRNNAKKRKGTKGKFKISLEVKNKRGTCPLQLLDKLDKICQEFGRHPRHREVFKLRSLEGKFFSGRGLIRSLEFVFGSWENAVKQLHWTDVDRTKRRKWNKKSLKQLLKDFVFIHKRFPYPSDVRRKIFPCRSTFKIYGGIRKFKEDLLKELIIKHA